MSGKSPQTEMLRCWAEIDLSALAHNAKICRNLAGERAGIMAIVKADAYGHGLERVVGALVDQVSWFGVATLAEAETATKTIGANSASIFILSPCLPIERKVAVTAGFSVAVSTREEIESYAEIATASGEKAKLHLKIDTGMGRVGCQPDEFPDLADLIRSTPQLVLEGIATHFPSADEDSEFTRNQYDQFMELASSEKSALVHLSNSAGLIGFHRETDSLLLVRTGLALYGISPLPEKDQGFKPVMSLKTRITLVRDLPAGSSISYGRTFTTGKKMKVATLGVGYGDGYLRHLSNQETEVLIHGVRCPLLGRVTMDQIVVDISHLSSSPSPGEEVVLIGRQGNAEITAAELAEKAGTIPWEILTGITSRVVRVDA